MARTERELSDAQWAKLVPLLPPQRPRMGRPPKNHRLIVEAVVWLDPRASAPHLGVRVPRTGSQVLR
jgi:transposase